MGLHNVESTFSWVSEIATWMNRFCGVQISKSLPSQHHWQVLSADICQYLKQIFLQRQELPVDNLLQLCPDQLTCQLRVEKMNALQKLLNSPGKDALRVHFRSSWGILREVLGLQLFYYARSGTESGWNHNHDDDHDDDHDHYNDTWMEARPGCSTARISPATRAFGRSSEKENGHWDRWGRIWTLSNSELVFNLAIAMSLLFSLRPTAVPQSDP